MSNTTKRQWSIYNKVYVTYNSLQLPYNYLVETTKMYRIYKLLHELYTF